MAAPSKTSARAMGAKGDAGVKADNRAIIQTTLVRNPRTKLTLEEVVKHKGQPVPRYVNAFVVWSFGAGRRITQATTFEKAISKASNKGYDVVNPDGTPLSKA